MKTPPKSSGAFRVFGKNSASAPNRLVIPGFSDAEPAEGAAVEHDRRHLGIHRHLTDP
jgi:hypothetical protein